MIIVFPLISNSKQDTWWCDRRTDSEREIFPRNNNRPHTLYTMSAGCSTDTTNTTTSTASSLVAAMTEPRNRDTPNIPDTIEEETSNGHMKKESEEELIQRLMKHTGKLTLSTESIGHRNVKPHRRTQSTALLSVLDPPQIRHRSRALSLADYPDLTKFYPGSHLVDKVAPDGSLYLSLWLLPPKHIHKRLSKEIAKLSLQHNHLGSSSVFVPHVTIIGSIRCETQREVAQLGEKLLKGLSGTGVVPCRFQPNPCLSMYNDQQKLVWSQSCVSIMYRSPEYMALLQKSREVLGLPPGEWMFPGPACEPHFSKYYGKIALEEPQSPPPDFDADEAALWLTTPGTLEGVALWREVTRIPLRSTTIPE
jgi:Cyclic phosphodiesterase-like protein